MAKLKRPEIRSEAARRNREQLGRLGALVRATRKRRQWTQATLAAQVGLSRLGRRAGYARAFEVAARPSDPSRSTDVGLRDDRRRTLVLVECWNTIGDVGAAARSTDPKLAEAADLAVVAGGERPFAVRGVWVVRATARNRTLLARYPEVFAARFPESSARWVAALTSDTDPPTQPGLVWCDVAATRLFAWRRRGT